MKYAFRVSLPAHLIARFRHALLSRFLVVRLSLLAKALACSLLLSAGPLWAAFTIIFNGVVSIVNTGSLVLSNPTDVAVDSTGNVYISDTSHSRILKVASDGTTSTLTITGLSPVLSSPGGLALDGAGNLYIADSGNARIVKVVPSGSGSAISTGSVILSSPQGVAVDVSGNLFIADTGNNRIVKVTSGGVAAVLGITGLGTPLNTPLGLAVDPAGNLYIADSVNSRIVVVAAGGAAGTVMNVSGVSLTTPAGLAVDSLGKLYVADTTNTQIVVVTISNGAASLINTGEVTLNQPEGVAVDPSGIVYVADTADNRAISVATSSASYGHTALGASSGKVLTLPFTVGIIATVGNVKVFTSGTENLDFTLQGTNSCTPGTTGNMPCSVDVQFLPTAPGLRRGAIVVYDNGSPQVPLIIVPLFGIGDAAQAAISPGPAHVISTGSVATSLPFQLALDGAGDIYSANYSGSDVVKIPVGGGSASVVPIATLDPAVEFITGVAVDGAGDLFFGDHLNSRIGIVSAGGYTSVLTISGLSLGLNEPTGIFFDGAGNLYISDFQNNRVVKVTNLVVAQNSSQSSSGIGSVVTPGTYTFALNSLTGVAVDPQGTVYFADRYGNRVVKVTSAGAASLVVTTPFTLLNPQGVTVDGMGNLYIADASNSRIVQVTTAGITSVVHFTGSVGALSSPYGVTVDSFGNILIPDWSNNRIVEVNISGANLTFPNTNVNAASAAQTATVTNLGDEALVFSANPTYTANFSNNSADTNPCTSSTSLSSGSVCDVAINFTPQTSGSQSANIILTNNTLNVPNSTQLVAVSGTGVSVGDTTSTTVTVTPSPLANGQTANLTATVADTVSGHAATHPTGTVSFTDTVGSTVVSLGTATLSGGVGAKTGVQLSGIGSHTITVTYAGVSGTFVASGGTATVALDKAPVTLAGPATQPILVTKGQASSAVITVSGPYTTLAAPTGTLAYSILNSLSVSVASGTLTLAGGSTSSTATIPIAGTLASGAYTISASYSGDSNYLPSSAPVTVAVTVSAVSPTISWNPGATSITYGASLSGILDATALSGSSTVAGTFAYTAASAASPFAVLTGTILSAGTYTLTATFTPTDTTSYAVVHSSVTLVVTKATVTITWNPGVTSITYGTSLSSILNASAANGSSTVAGTFAYTAASGASPFAILGGTILAGGTYTLTATFTPTDATDFAAAPSSITLVVTKATATISWSPGTTSITYGASLSSILDATALNGSSTVAGTFAYAASASGTSPFAVAPGTILPAGSYTLTATFTPSDTTSYTAAPSSITLMVGKASAVISLTSPSSTVAPGNAVVFTAAVSYSAGTPTGSVSFFDGTTLLATIALSGGTAAYSTSSLAAGAHSITATYTGDNNFAASTSSAIVETVQDFDLTLSPSSPGGTTQTVMPGGTATYALALGPASGLTFPAAISLTVSGLPPGATATITPQVLAAGSGLTSVTLTIVLAKTTAALGGDDPSRRLAPMLVGLLVLPFAVRIRRPGARSGRRVCALLVVMAGCSLVAGLSGCGSSGSGFFGHPQQSYSIVITATSGSISHTTTVALIVE
jgi:sugar lactone lactonase YvrE